MSTDLQYLSSNKDVMQKRMERIDYLLEDSVTEINVLREKEQKGQIKVQVVMSRFAELVKKINHLGYDDISELSMEAVDKEVNQRWMTSGDASDVSSRPSGGGAAAAPQVWAKDGETGKVVKANKPILSRVKPAGKSVTEATAAGALKPEIDAKIRADEQVDVPLPASKQVVKPPAQASSASADTKRGMPSTMDPSKRIQNTLADQIPKLDHTRVGVCKQVGCSNKFVKTLCAHWNSFRESCPVCKPVRTYDGTEEPWTRCKKCETWFPSTQHNGTSKTMRVNCKACRAGGGGRRKASVSVSGSDVSRPPPAKKRRQEMSPIPEDEPVVQDVSKPNTPMSTAGGRNRVVDDISPDDSASQVSQRRDTFLSADEADDEAEESRVNPHPPNSDVSGAETGDDRVDPGFVARLLVKAQGEPRQPLTPSIDGSEPGSDPEVARVDASIDEVAESTEELRQEQEQQQDQNQEQEQEQEPAQVDTPVANMTNEELDQVPFSTIHYSETLSILFDAGIGNLVCECFKIKSGADLCRIKGVNGNMHQLAELLGWTPGDDTFYHGLDFDSAKSILRKAWAASKREADVDDRIKRLQASVGSVPPRTPPRNRKREDRKRSKAKPIDFGDGGKVSQKSLVPLPQKELSNIQVGGSSSSTQPVPVASQAVKLNAYGRRKRQKASDSGYHAFCQANMTPGELYYTIHPNRVLRKKGPAEEMFNEKQLDEYNMLMFFMKSEIGMYSKTIWSVCGTEGPVPEETLDPDKLKVAWKMLERSAVDLGAGSLSKMGSELFRYIRWSRDLGMSAAEYLLPTPSHLYSYLEEREENGESVPDNVLKTFSSAVDHLGIQFPKRDAIPHVKGLIRSKKRRILPEKVTFTPGEIVLLERQAFRGDRIAASLLLCVWSCLRLGHAQRSRVEWDANERELDQTNERESRTWCVYNFQTKADLGVEMKYRITLCSLSGLKWWKHIEADLRADSVWHRDFFIMTAKKTPMAPGSLNRVAKECFRRCGFKDERVAELTGHSCRRFVISCSHPLKSSCLDLHYLGLWATDDQTSGFSMPDRYADSRLIRADLLKWNVQKLLRLWYERYGNFDKWSISKFVEFVQNANQYDDRKSFSEEAFEKFLHMWD